MLDRSSIHRRPGGARSATQRRLTNQILHTCPIEPGPVCYNSIDRPQDSVAHPAGSFTFVLHSHIPYTRAAGRWPHGEEWLHEAAAETYVPLLDMLHRLRADGVRGGITLGLTPVLVEQLADEDVQHNFSTYLDEKIAAARADVPRFEEFWRTASGRVGTVQPGTIPDGPPQFPRSVSRKPGTRVPGDGRIRAGGADHLRGDPRLPAPPRPRRVRSRSSSGRRLPRTDATSGPRRGRSGFRSAPIVRAT